MHEKGDGLKQEEISNLAAELTDLKAEGAWVCWLRSHWGQMVGRVVMEKMWWPSKLPLKTL